MQEGEALEENSNLTGHSWTASKACIRSSSTCCIWKEGGGASVVLKRFPQPRRRMILLKDMREQRHEDYLKIYGGRTAGYHSLYKRRMRRHGRAFQRIER